EQTFEEAKYLKELIESGTLVRVKMAEGEEVVGTIEYYDQSFIRLTRDGQPNLFIFKHDIVYIQERRKRADAISGDRRGHRPRSRVADRRVFRAPRRLRNQGRIRSGHRG